MATTSNDRVTGISTSEAVKAPCKVATTSNITLSGVQVIDGVTVVSGDRVLVREQTNASENGIYVVNSTAWKRAKDWNGARDVVQYTSVYVGAGDTYTAGTWRVITSGNIVIGNTEIEFEKDASLTSVSAENVDGLASVATSGDYNDLSNLPTITGTGDMTAAVYDPAGKEEQVITVSDIGDLASLDTVDTAQIEDGAVTYAKMQAVSANKILGSIAGGVVEEITTTSYGRDLLAGASALAQRASLGLGSMATQSAAAVAITGGTITGLPTPSSTSDAATKEYVDSAVTGTSNILQSVRVATVSNHTLSSGFSNGQVVDGITLVTGDRILIKNQTTASQNGIYEVQSSGAPIRTSDANSAGELEACVVFVESGSVNANTVWTCITKSITVDTTALVFTQFGTQLTGAQSQKLAAICLWIPSDPTGTSDMTTELQNFVAANQGYVVKVKEGSTILLNNAFQSVTSGDIKIDFTNVIIKHNNTSRALYLNNTSNAVPEVIVNTIAEETVNADARVTTAELASTMGALRFDWVALYSNDPNPAKSGGFLGEIAQIALDESANKITFMRKLNRHSSYTTSIKARKLSSTRKVWIKGGLWTANGNTHDQSITTRSESILCMGFVDPEFHGLDFYKTWSIGIRFQANAAIKCYDCRMRDVGNLAGYNGFTYLYNIYGMNDAFYLANSVGRNARHAGGTTDGYSDGTSSVAWYFKGIPTNGIFDGIFAVNCGASPVDSHEEGDSITYNNCVSYDARQDKDIFDAPPSFTGLAAQIRAANVTVNGLTVYGGNRAVKVVDVDHGFEDNVILNNVIVRNLLGGSTDSDIAIQIDSQAGITNKRNIRVSNIIASNIGTLFDVGETAKLTIQGDVTCDNVKTYINAKAGCIIIGMANWSLDYRNATRPAPYYVARVRSDVIYGGATVIFMRAPTIIKGNATNKPTHIFDEFDIHAPKYVFCPTPIEYNPSGVTATALYETGATTFSIVPITGIASDALTIASNLSDISDKTIAFNNISPLTTKGDIIVSDGINNVRLPVGTNNFILTADSAQPNGIKWAAAGSGVTSFYGLSEVTSTTVTRGSDTGVLKKSFGMGVADYLLFNQASTVGHAYSNTIHIARTANYIGGSTVDFPSTDSRHGWVNAALYANTSVSSTAASFEWAIVGVCDNSSTSGENVGIYGQGLNKAAGKTWGMVAEARDLSSSGVTPVNVWGMEIDIFANRTHTNNNLLGCFIVGGKAATGTTPKIFTGLLVDSQGNSNANATWSNGVLVGDYSMRTLFGGGTPLDCDNAFRAFTNGNVGFWDGGTKQVGFYAEGTYTGGAFRMKQGANFSWDIASTVNSSYDGTTINSNRGLKVTNVSSGGAYFSASGGSPTYGIDFGSVSFTSGMILRSSAFDFQNDGQISFKKSAVFSATAGSSASRYLQIKDGTTGTSYKIALLNL